MATAGALGGLRILLVDDDEGSLEAVSTLLALNGAEVRCCIDAGAARRALGAFRPHLIISDLAMPVEDGFELVMAIRALSAEEGGRTPAIAYSGDSDTETRARALASGFDGFASKPLDGPGLLRLIVALAPHPG